VILSYRIDPEIELRLLEERHAEEAYRLVDQNRAYLQTWLPWLTGVYSLEDTRAYYKRNLQGFTDQTGYTLAIFYLGQMVGEAGYNFFDWPNHLTELGCWLVPQFQGRGLITLVCRALITHAFDQLHLNRVEIQCAVENRPSRRLAERLGFQQEGILRQAEWLHNRYVDIVMYSMLAHEWKG
jgi:ribosomal-protein-serine acetyltransferase